MTLTFDGLGEPSSITSGATAVFMATSGLYEGTLTVTIDGSVDQVASGVFRVTLESESQSESSGV